MSGSLVLIMSQRSHLQGSRGGAGGVGGGDILLMKKVSRIVVRLKARIVTFLLLHNISGHV